MRDLWVYCYNRAPYFPIVVIVIAVFAVLFDLVKDAQISLYEWVVPMLIVFIVVAVIGVLLAVMSSYFRLRKKAAETTDLLGYKYGGIFKRIDENRELVELLQNEAPEFVEKHFWIVRCWLKSQDDFLCDLSKLVDEEKVIRFKKKAANERHEGSAPYPRVWPGDEFKSRIE